MDWFLYVRNLRHERVKDLLIKYDQMRLRKLRIWSHLLKEMET